MAQTKNALIRQQVIDRCLSSIGDYSVRKMMEKCNIALEARGCTKVTARGTIISDINNIQDNFPKARIVKRRVGRSIYYEYADKSFSIYNIPLNDDEMAHLAQTISILSKFEGMPNFDWVDDLIERFKSTLNVPTTRETIVVFDENFDLRGRNWFTKLFYAIASQQTLEITYQPFNKEAKTSQIHPYLLKQYNNRWFLFGSDEKYFPSVTNFPLDRITRIDPSSVPYRKNEIDFQEYFEDMVGVTKKPNQKATKIIMKVLKNTYPFIETKPLHGSQKVLDREEDGTIIQIEVLLNHEIVQLLQSYGPGLIVLSPIELQSILLKNAKQVEKNYQSVQLN